MSGIIFYLLLLGGAYATAIGLLFVFRAIKLI